MALAAAATSVAMIAGGCSGEGGDEGPDEVTWVINSLPAAWQGISIAGGSVYVIQMLSGVLPNTGHWDPEGEYQYNMDVLAEEPELINEDPDEGTVEWQYTFNEDAVWSDGTPMSGEDLRATWMMSAAPGEGHCEGCDPRDTTTYDKIEEIETEGQTATVRLKDGVGNPEWQETFDAHNIAGGFLPAHLAEENDWDIDDPAQLGEYYDWLHSTMPEWSGGPYQIVEGDLDNEVIKEPNPEWFGDEPGLDRIRMPFNDDEGTFYNAFVNDEIDGANPADYNEDVFTQLEGLGDVNMDIGEGETWEHLSFNLEVEAFEDVALRRAIFTAIDRDDIASRNYEAGYPEYELKNNHVFGSDSEYFVDHYEDETQGTGDIDAATEILEDAGYEIDGDQLTLDGEEVGPFSLRSTDSGVRNTSVQLIQQKLAEIGITANIDMTDDLGTMTAEGDYDIVQFGWSGSPWFATNPEQFWHSESGSNFGNYSNDEVDELATEVANAPTLDEAADLANETMEILVPDAYVMPIMAEPNYFFADERLENVHDNLNSSYRATYNIGEWTLADQ